MWLDCPACAQRLALFHPWPPCSPHLQEDLPELRADLEKGVQVATVRQDAVGREIVGLEGLIPPGAAVDGDKGYTSLVRLHTSTPCLFNL